MPSLQIVLKHPVAGLALLAMAQFIIAVDYNIVYVALPSIGSALGFSAVHLQWVVSAYALAFGGFLLLGGRLGDVFGRRTAFVVALVLYAGSSWAGGLATGPGLLIAARAVQGLGGALLFPTTLALIATYFAEGTERNRALAVMGAAGASGGASGALLGGLLTSAFGWHWTFFVNMPIAALVVIGALWVLPRDEPRNAKVRIDLPGALTATAGLVSLVTACIEGPELGWTSSIVVGLLMGALMLLGGFLLIESRTAAPLMPLRLLRHSSLPTGMLICALFASAFGAQYFLLTTYLQEVRQLAPQMAGLAFLPFALSIVAGTRIGGRLVNRVGLRNGLLVGLALGVAGLLLVAFSLSAEGSYTTRLLPGFLLDGLGQGITWTLMWIAATSGIDARDRGIASGMASTAQQVGAALGLALLVGIATPSLEVSDAQTSIPAITVGLRHALFAASLLATLAALVALARIPARPKPISDLPTAA